MGKTVNPQLLFSLYQIEYQFVSCYSYYLRTYYRRLIQELTIFDY